MLSSMPSMLAEIACALKEVRAVCGPLGATAGTPMDWADEAVGGVERAAFWETARTFTALNDVGVISCICLEDCAPL